MAQHILVIGGVALGPKAASRYKRLMPDSRVTLIDENIFISYGGCGIPYYMSGEINNIDDLRSTNYHTVRDAAYFSSLKGVEVRTQTRALSIDRAAKTVLVEEVPSGKQERISYDQLVLATGASPRIPPVEGHQLDGVFAVTKLEAAQSIRKDCEAGKINQAVIVGAGFIGLECAVALADMWGVECSVVEMVDQALPGALSATLGGMVRHDLEAHKVTLYTGEQVLRLEGEGGRVARVVTSERTIEAQVVIFAAGFIPNSRLAKEAGLNTAAFGGVLVNDRMQTSDPSIYSGGDCVAMTNLITGKSGYLPLGSLANRQGRIIGTNLAGGDARLAGYVGTWAVKLFEMSFCGVGLTVEKARAEGYDAIGVCIEQLDRAHFYPDKFMMSLELVVERGTRRVLGAQGACAAGDSLKARIDAIAGVLQYSRPTLDDISNLEVCYSPPFASAMDVVNTVANVADNVLAGRFQPITAQEHMHNWHDREHNAIFFVDARPKAASQAVEASYPEWHSIPLEEIEARINEIPTDRQVALVCNTGLRAYESELILARHGITNVTNVMGGLQAAGKMGLKIQE